MVVAGAAIVAVVAAIVAVVAAIVAVVADAAFLAVVAVNKIAMTRRFDIGSCRESFQPAVC